MDIIRQLNDFIKHIGIDYAICGGHAIDLFIGKKTRPHKDLDVVIFKEDRNKIIQFMIDNGWDIYEPCGNEILHKIVDINDQKLIKTNIWCVKPENRHYEFIQKDINMFSVKFDNSEQIELDFIEYLLNKRVDGYFLYSRNNDIKLNMNSCILYFDDIPFLTPELVLLYKSKGIDIVPENQIDFDNVFYKLNESQKVWLKDSLNVMFPEGHKWMYKINL